MAIHITLLLRALHAMLPYMRVYYGAVTITMFTHERYIERLMSASYAIGDSVDTLRCVYAAT